MDRAITAASAALTERQNPKKPRVPAAHGNARRNSRSNKNSAMAAVVTPAVVRLLQVHLLP
ncbi:MAG: hypothetical protein WCA36_10190, partial [Pseudolabrys sp.]